MNKQQYSEFLKDKRWKKLRLLILKRDKYRCTQCGKDRCELHVHHKLYITGKKPWEYKEEHLQTLCEPCHKELHKNFIVPVISAKKESEIVILPEVSFKTTKSNSPRPKKDNRKKLGKKDQRVKNQIDALKTREQFIQRIGTLYFGIAKGVTKTHKERKEGTLYLIRKLRRAYVEQYGTNYDGMPIEIVNKFFLDWDG